MARDRCWIVWPVLPRDHVDSEIAPDLADTYAYSSFGKFFVALGAPVLGIILTTIAAIKGSRCGWLSSPQVLLVGSSSFSVYHSLGYNRQPTPEKRCQFNWSVQHHLS